MQLKSLRAMTVLFVFSQDARSPTHSPRTAITSRSQICPRQCRSTDYQFGIVVLNVDKKAKGTGTLAPVCKIKFNKKNDRKLWPEALPPRERLSSEINIRFRTNTPNAYKDLVTLSALRPFSSGLPSHHPSNGNPKALSIRFTIRTIWSHTHAGLSGRTIRG